jgi:hypothetical protein
VCLGLFQEESERESRAAHSLFVFDGAERCSLRRGGLYSDFAGRRLEQAND